MSNEVKGVSGRALAKLLGVSEVAVRKAADPDVGRIRDARLPGGLFDPVLAERLWRANSMPTQQRKVTSKTDASEETVAVEPQPAGDKVVQFPGPRPSDDVTARLNEHQRKNLEKAGKAPETADPQDETSAAINKRIQAEKLRKIRIENDLLDKTVMQSGPALMLVQTFARETRDAWTQFTAKFVPGIAAEMDLKDREHELDMVIRRAIDKHLVETIEKIDVALHLSRIAGEHVK